MASYGSNSRYKSSAGREAAIEHIKEYEKFKREIGGSITEVENYFFSLNLSQKNEIFTEYGKKFGSLKEDYARQTITKWQTGKVQMSGLVAKRLFSLLPNYMPLETKYHLTETLWKHVSPKSKSKLVFDSDTPTEDIIQSVQKQLDNDIVQHSIPAQLEKRFDWLAGDDVEVKQQLLNFIRIKERELSSEAFASRLPMLKELVSNNKHNTKANHIIEIGRSEISIEIVNISPPAPARQIKPAKVSSQRLNKTNAPYSKPSKEPAQNYSSLWFLLIFCVIAFVWILNLEEKESTSSFATQYSALELKAEESSSSKVHKNRTRESEWRKNFVETQSSQINLSKPDQAETAETAETAVSNTPEVKPTFYSAAPTSSIEPSDSSNESTVAQNAEPLGKIDEALAFIGAHRNAIRTKFGPPTRVFNSQDSVDWVYKEFVVKISVTNLVTDVISAKQKNNNQKQKSSITQAQKKKISNNDVIPTKYSKFIGLHRNKLRKELGAPIKVTKTGSITKWHYKEFNVEISASNLVSKISIEKISSTKKKLMAAEGPRAAKNNTPPKAVNVTQSLSKVDKQALEYACASAKYEGPAKYRDCKKVHLEDLSFAPKQLSSKHLSPKERTSLEYACASAKHQGPSSYRSCINEQLKLVKNSPSLGSSSHLTGQERTSLEYACASAKHKGPAPYRACQNNHLKNANQAPKVGSLTHLLADERVSLEYACASAKHNGPASYRTCQVKLLKILASTPKVGNTSHLTNSERTSLEYACASAKHQGPAAFRLCKIRQLKLAALVAKPNNLNRLSPDARQSLEYACSSAKHSGPGAYRKCLSQQMFKLK